MKNKLISGLAAAVNTIAPATSPIGGLSIFDNPNTAITSVPTPNSEVIEKLPPDLSAFCLSKGRPNPTFLVVRVVKKGI